MFPPATRATYRVPRGAFEEVQAESHDGRCEEDDLHALAAPLPPGVEQWV